MKLILHAGLPKTGSSYLQSYLYHKSNILSKNGIYFPVPYGYGENDVIKGGNAKEICRLMSVKKIDKILILLDKIYIKAKKKNCDVILLSQEGFYSQIPKLDSNKAFRVWLLEKRIEKLDIILVVRNPYHYLFSLYKQRCRTGKNINYHDFLNTNDNLDRIINFFQSSLINNLSNLHLINFDLYRAGLKDKFIECLIEVTKINTTEEILNFSNKKKNRSLTLKEIKILQSIYKVNRGLAFKVSRFMSRFEILREDNALKEIFITKAKQIQKQKVEHIVKIYNKWLNNMEQLHINDE